jgi:hypothetical protein
MIAELDNRRGLKHSVLIDHELAMGQGVDIALDQEEIGTAFHWQEAFARDVDAMCVLEMLDRSTSGRFELGLT